MTNMLKMLLIKINIFYTEGSIYTYIIYISTLSFKVNFRMIIDSYVLSVVVSRKKQFSYDYISVGN